VTQDIRVNRSIEFIRLDWVDIPILTILIWGWVRWAKHKQPRTRYSIPSLIGFALGTVSGLLAITSMLYADVVGGFPYYDPKLIRIFGLGGLLSIAGIVFAIGGLRESSALRWHGLCFSVGMLLFWFMSAAGE
jgi:hypothetical protein